MASNEDILKEAKYYLDNNVTIEQASKDLGISKRTFQLHLGKLKDISPDMYKLVTDKKEASMKQGRVVGGTLGKRGPSWSVEDANRITKAMISQNMTYEEAEERFGIPKSTIYEMVHKTSDDETDSILYALAEANRKGIPLDTVLNRYKRDNFEGTVSYDNSVSNKGVKK